MRCRGADQQRLVVKADAARHCAAKVGNILRLKPQRPVLTILVVQQWQTDQIGWVSAACDRGKARNRGLHTGIMAMLAIRSQRSPG